MEPIYLDNNATTRVDPDVARAMMRFLTDDFGNPSSAHRFGRAPREALAEARRRVAAALGAQPEQIRFAGSGTAADVFVLSRRFAGRPGGRLVTTAIEHPAVLTTARELARGGVEVDVLPVDGDGRLRIDALRRSLERGADLAAIMLANNETGAIQPVAEAAALCRQAGVPLFSDAVNAAGKIPVDVRELGVDALALSAHKFHGPKGTGVLFLRDPALVRPIHQAGGQEGGLFPGTENVAGAVGLAEALDRATVGLAENAARMGALASSLLEAIRAVRPDAVLNVASPAYRLPNTLSVVLPGRRATELLARLDEAGVAVSAGSACHSGCDSPSPVLLAMGRTPAEAGSTLRISLARTTTPAEIEEAARIFSRILI